MVTEYDSILYSRSGGAVKRGVKGYMLRNKLVPFTIFPFFMVVMASCGPDVRVAVVDDTWEGAPFLTRAHFRLLDGGEAAGFDFSGTELLLLSPSLSGTAPLLNYDGPVVRFGGYRGALKGETTGDGIIIVRNDEEPFSALGAHIAGEAKLSDGEEKPVLLLYRESVVPRRAVEAFTAAVETGAAVNAAALPDREAAVAEKVRGLAWERFSAAVLFTGRFDRVCLELLPERLPVYGLGTEPRLEKGRGGAANARYDAVLVYHEMLTAEKVLKEWRKQGDKGVRMVEAAWSIDSFSFPENGLTKNMLRNIILSADIR